MLFVFKFIITLDDFFFYVYHKIFYTIEYLVSNDIDLVNDKLKLNPILSVCNSKLKERYGIDIKKIKFRGISKWMI